jgi:ABC-type antimicrobial peptide transport system permease subunit
MKSMPKNLTMNSVIEALGGLFAGLAIFISCLGLFGLVTYMQNRIKEIGIRKVLGASVISITGLISKEFLKLVAFSFIIASSIAWLIMNKWLLNYEYRISIQWWVFVSAGLLSFLIAIFTVSFQAIKAALANPVKSLRTDDWEKYNWEIGK